MPATPRTPALPGALLRHLTLAVLPLALVLGLGLGVTTATAPSAHAAPSAGGQSAGTTDTAARPAAKKQRLKKKQKKQRVSARVVTSRKVGRARGIALAQRGDSYGYGATGPNSFDCSGLVQFAYRNAGFPGMPRTSGAQAGHTRRIAKTAMQPGDLMFFANGGGVYHVGIFIGRGPGGVPLMVHSSRPGTPVSVSAPWTSAWFAGTMRA